MAHLKKSRRNGKLVKQRGGGHLIKGCDGAPSPAEPHSCVRIGDCCYSDKALVRASWSITFPIRDFWKEPSGIPVTDAQWAHVEEYIRIMGQGVMQNIPVDTSHNWLDGQAATFDRVTGRVTTTILGTAHTFRIWVFVQTDGKILLAGGASWCIRIALLCETHGNKEVFYFLYVPMRGGHCCGFTWNQTRTDYTIQAPIVGTFDGVYTTASVNFLVTVGIYRNYCCKPEMPDEWNPILVYNTGDRAKYGGYVYESLIDRNANTTPGTDGTKWRYVNWPGCMEIDHEACDTPTSDAICIEAPP